MYLAKCIERFVFIILLLSVVSCELEEDHDERDMQHTWKFVQAIQDTIPMQWLEQPPHWRELARLDISSKEQHPPMERVAKNAIFFIGDGMGISAITAARIFKGQKDDGLRFGEEAVLHMDTFPWTGTSKTYCLDTQVADSSCSASAYLCGAKARFATAGLTPGALFADCNGQNKTENHLTSVVEWAQREGKSTGIITTGRVTAIPGAANWAGVARRSWETDEEVKEWGMDPEVCPDTGTQLVRNEAGKQLNVLMGGGRNRLTPVEEPDIETGNGGRRTDGRNIVNEWLATKPQNEVSRYITGRDQLLGLDTSTVDNLLGSFASHGLSWAERLEADNDPTMEEMVEAAVKILSKNPNGFFLFVHGSRIDSAHHANKPGRVLREIVEFDKAVKKGDEITNDEDTLLVVSADHSHTIGFSGYNVRGNPILKHSIIPADDGFVFPSLYFANGPGPSWMNPDTGRRRNIIFDDVDAPDYEVPVPVPLFSEAHASEDVPIYAKGPYAHYFAGVHEQSTIPHLIAYATCTGEGLRNVHCNQEGTTPSTPLPPNTGTTGQDRETTTTAGSAGMDFYFMVVVGLLSFVSWIGNWY